MGALQPRKEAVCLFVPAKENVRFVRPEGSQRRAAPRDTSNSRGLNVSMDLPFALTLSTSSASVLRSRGSARSRFCAYLKRVIISDRRLLRRRPAAFLESKKSSISSDRMRSIDRSAPKCLLSSKISALSLSVYADEWLALASRNFWITSPKGRPLLEPFARCHS